VLVTSQQRLFGQLQGAERLEIAPLGEESWELLAQFLPLARIEREKSDLARLIRTLGALPLALAIAMSRLAEEPQWTPADYLQHLETNWQHQQAVIDQAFRLTYARLSSAHRQMFRAMGVLGLAAISAEALAYILEIDLEQAITDLNALCRTSLLNYLKPSSYHLHPALWEFARNLDHEQRWQERVVRYYVDFTRQHVLHYARLEAELEQILWALRLAWQRQTYPLLMEGLASLFSYLEDKGLLNRIAPLLEQLYQLLQAQEASALLAPAAYYYSRLLRRQGNWEHAELLARRALQIAETFQDSRILLLAHNSLGIHAHHRGELGAALDHFYQARRVIEAEKLYGYRYANLINTAEILCKLDRLEDAERDLLEVLALTEQEPPENQLTLGMLCSAYLQLFLIARRRQDADTAAAYYQKGLALARSLDHQALEQAFLDAKE
jgi:tetratricopeptide (TPR) repeat protein